MISGNVDGKVAEVPAAMSDVTSVISVTGAYAAETTAVAPEDTAGSQEELDGSYALLEDEDGFGATVEWVGEARQQDPDAPALLAETADTEVMLDPTWITKIAFEKKVNGSWETNGWRIEGSFWEWDYDILAPSRHTVAHIAKELWNWTDTYTIEVADPRDALCALMVVLAIDAEKCSRYNHT